MRPVSSTLLNKLKSKEYRPAILVEINISGASLYLTTWSDPIYFNNIMYDPRGMEVGAINYGTSSIVSGCTLDVDDVDRFLYSILGSNEAGDWLTTITLVVLDDAGEFIPGSSAVIFKGNTTEWSYIPGKTSIKLSSPLNKWAKVTTRLFSTSCNVKVFKSLQCGYIGAGSVCDRTYKQCKIYSNTVNFRGFRWLEDMADKRLEMD